MPAWHSAHALLPTKWAPGMVNGTSTACSDEHESSKTTRAAEIAKATRAAHRLAVQMYGLGLIWFVVSFYGGSIKTAPLKPPLEKNP